MSGMSRNLMGPYDQGVPSPRTVHVHPYPTRYHGTINTRPMFSLPFQYQPHAVFKPDDFSRPTDGLGRQPVVSGLGSLQYNTGRGIFRPGGYGGGIFDNNLAGLGYTADSLPWLKYSADTVEFQKDLNVLLRAAGKPTVSEDGEMGPSTCNACRSLDACRPVPTACSQSTTTVPVTTAPSLPMTTDASLMPGGGGMSSTTKNILAFAGAGAAVLGIAYLVMRKRG